MNGLTGDAASIYDEKGPCLLPRLATRRRTRRVAAINISYQIRGEGRWFVPKTRLQLHVGQGYGNLRWEKGFPLLGIGSKAVERKYLMSCLQACFIGDQGPDSGSGIRSVHENASSAVKQLPSVSHIPM
jgi:hypothetical protein